MTRLNGERYDSFVSSCNLYLTRWKNCNKAPSFPCSLNAFENTNVALSFHDAMRTFAVFTEFERRERRGRCDGHNVNTEKSLKVRL